MQSEKVMKIWNRKYWIWKHRIEINYVTHANNEDISNYVREKYSIEIQVLEARHFCTEKREDVSEGTF